MARVKFRTKGGQIVSFLTKGSKKKTRKRRVVKTARRRGRARRVYARARRSYSSSNRLMRGMLPMSSPINKALAGVGVAALQERVLPQVIPYQGVAIGFIIGGIPGAAGAFAKDLLTGGTAAAPGAAPGVSPYTY